MPKVTSKLLLCFGFLKIAVEFTLLLYLLFIIINFLCYSLIQWHFCIRI